MVDRKIRQYRQVNPRRTVEIHLPDGRVFRGPRNSPVGDFFKSILDPGSVPIVGAIVNGELRELTYPIKIDSMVSPIWLLEAKMVELGGADLPFSRRVIPLELAMRTFREKGELDKVRLLAHRTKNYLTIYRLRNFYDYHHGYMVPS